MPNSPFDEFLTPNRHVRKKSDGEEYFNMPCPFCEDHGRDRAVCFMPSVNNPYGNFYCRKCKRSLNGIQFLSLYHNISLEKASQQMESILSTQRLPEKIKTEARKESLWQTKAKELLEESQNLLWSRKPLLNLFIQRGFTLESIQRFGFGWHMAKSYCYEEWGIPYHKPKTSFFVDTGLLIPIRDINNTLTGIKIRILNKDAYAKYHLFGGSLVSSLLPAPWKEGLPAILVEGDFDAYSISQEAGDLINVISIGGGAKVISPSLEERLQKAPYILIATDQDTAGEDFAAYFLQRFPHAFRLPMPACAKDPNDALRLGVDIATWILRALPRDIREKCIQQKSLPINLISIENEHQSYFSPLREISVEEIEQEELVALHFDLSHNRVLFFNPHIKQRYISYTSLHITAKKTKFIVFDSYELAPLLHSIGITQSVESVSLMAKLDTHSTVSLQETLIGLYEYYLLYKKSNPLSSIEKYYTLVRDVQKYLGDIPDFCIDLRAYEEILQDLEQDQSKQALVSTWKSILTKYRDKGRIPIHFRPHAGVAGRFSSFAPPLHALPEALRKAFIPEEGKVFLIADFHTIQPRILAELTKDPLFRGIFEKGKDYYAVWASAIFDKHDTQITAEERACVKSAAIAWGNGASQECLVLALQENIQAILGQTVSRRALQEGLQRFFSAFSRVSSWNTLYAEKAAKHGYVFTSSGRPITIPRDKSFAASSFIATGTEVEIMLRAILSLGLAYEEDLPEARIKFWLHDELIVEVSKEKSILAKKMLDWHLMKAFHDFFPDAPDRTFLDESQEKMSL